MTTLKQKICVAAIWLAGIAVACTLGVLNGAEYHAAPARPPASVGGGNFLPAYTNLIQRRQFPPNMCQPRDRDTLLAPCDQP